MTTRPAKAPATAVPQPGQNLASGGHLGTARGSSAPVGDPGAGRSWHRIGAPTGFSASQLAQTTVGGASDVPQDAQNLAPGHVGGMAVGADDAIGSFRRLAGAAASGTGTGVAAPATREPGAGGGGGPGCSRRGGLSAEAHAGGQERPAGRSATLGHALAGAEHHLPGRVLLEAAGQPGVCGVLGEGLQLASSSSDRLMSKLPMRMMARPYEAELLVALVDHHLSISGV